MMKGQKGITLIALVITIIVMLILVGVTVTVAMQGGLLDKAREAANRTEENATLERRSEKGYVNVNGKYYDMQDYADHGASASEISAASLAE